MENILRCVVCHKVDKENVPPGDVYRYQKACDMAFSGSLIPKLPTPPEVSEDLLQKAFKEAIVIDWESDDSDLEWEAYIDSEDRIHRTSLLKSLLLNNLSMEKTQFMSVFQKKTSSAFSFIDSKCAELYLSLQKDIRSHNLLRKEGYSSMSNPPEMEYITDRIFFYLNRLLFVHKRLLNKDVTVNILSMDKLYDIQQARIKKSMASIVSKHKDSLLVDMERDPDDSYQRYFSLCPCDKMATCIEKSYIQPTIDRVNADLSKLQPFAESCISKARVGIANRSVSRPYLLRGLANA